MLLIHGLGCNAERSFAIPSATLSRTYRVITVDLDGYDGKGSVFTTIPDQAEKIAVFLRKHCDGKPESFLHGILSWQQEKTIIRGAYILKERLPKMRIICTGEYGHGELMFTDPQRYTELIAKEMRDLS